MLIKEVYDLYGSWAELSRKLGFGSSTYQGWLTRGYIPLKTQELIEFRTKGKLRAAKEHPTKEKNLELLRKNNVNTNKENHENV